MGKKHASQYVNFGWLPNSYRKNIELKQVQSWVLFLDDLYNNLNISLD